MAQLSVGEGRSSDKSIERERSRENTSSKKEKNNESRSDETQKNVGETRLSRATNSESKYTLLERSTNSEKPAFRVSDDKDFLKFETPDFNNDSTKDPYRDIRCADYDDLQPGDIGLVFGDDPDNATGIRFNLNELALMGSIALNAGKMNSSSSVETFVKSKYFEKTIKDKIGQGLSELGVTSSEPRCFVFTSDSFLPRRLK